MRLPLLAVLPLLAACAASPIRGAAPGPIAAPGTLTVSVTPDLAWPFRLERSLLAVDGARYTSGTPIGATPGLHTVTVEAEITIACSLFSSDRSKVRVRASKTVEIDEAPASIRVRLFADPGFTHEHEERLDVAFELAGARDSLRFIPAPPAACLELSPPHADACRVAAQCDDARRRRDIIYLSCAAEKLAIILARLPAADAGNAAASDEIARLEREAEQCIGEEIAWVGSREVLMETGCGTDLDRALAEN